MSRLATSVILCCGAFVTSAAFGAFVGLDLVPPTWRGVSRVEVDWSKMPIEASGGERGTVGWILKTAASQGGVALRDSFVEQSASRLQLPRENLTGCLDVIPSRGSNDSVACFDIVVHGLDRERSSVIVGEATAYVGKVFDVYRGWEGVGQGVALGSEADRTGEHGQFLIQVLSMAASDPIKVTTPPHVERDLRRTALATVLLGGFFGLVGLAATALALILASRRHSQRPTRSRDFLHPAQELNPCADTPPKLDEISPPFAFVPAQPPVIR